MIKFSMLSLREDFPACTPENISFKMKLDVSETFQYKSHLFFCIKPEDIAHHD